MSQMETLTITLSDVQRDELLDISMKSFKEAGLAQAIRDEYSWWEKLIGYYPSRVQRIEGLTFNITID
jgi:hypothetical protein